MRTKGKVAVVLGAVMLVPGGGLAYAAVDVGADGKAGASGQLDAAASHVEADMATDTADAARPRRRR
ncbi:MAG: hypothetical protein BRC32_04505 [Actinobacteria bacterium QS_8_72_14]|nr:MAG: hypothetical protein BRC32_04505 [Actinobacteria bacterium QS_8_72_14]